MVTVTKRFTFEASHYLPDYDGKCSRLHGHSYKLEVTVAAGEVHMNGSERGMVMDFKKLKDIVDEHVISVYDHENLNDHFLYPTAELMVQKIAYDIQSYLPEEVALYNVRLWETEDSYVDFFFPEVRDSDMYAMQDCPGCRVNPPNQIPED